MRTKQCYIKYQSNHVLIESFSFTDSYSIKHPSQVYNVVPGDFTHSGKLDLLVMSKSGSNSQIDLTLYPSLVGDGFGMSVHDSSTGIIHHLTSDTSNPLILPPSITSQPIPLDIDGDMKIDLLGMTPDSTGSSTSPFQVWQNVWNGSATNPVLFKL